MTSIAAAALLLIIWLTWRLRQARHAGPAQFFAHAPEIACVLDRGGRLRHANRAWYDRMGGSPQTWLGRHLGELVHPDDRSRVHHGMQQLTEGQSVSIDLRCCSADGHDLYLQWRATPATDCHIHAVFHDLAACRRTEETLRSLLSFRQTLSDALPCGIAVVDMGGRIIDANPAFAQLTGVPSPIPPGQYPAFAAASAEYAQAFRRSLAGSTMAEGLRLCLRRPGMPPVWAHLQIIPLHLAAKAQAGWILCLTADAPAPSASPTHHASAVDIY